jgi:hypothetical protein
VWEFSRANSRVSNEGYRLENSRFGQSATGAKHLMHPNQTERIK